MENKKENKVIVDSAIQQVGVLPTIVDKEDRMILQEGRGMGMGFAFLKFEDGVYKTVQPISPCKDYLNDVVYSEATGKVCTVYGLKYNKKDIFNQGKAFIAMSMCPYNGGSKYPTYDKDVVDLKGNIENIQSFINFYEQKGNY